MQLEQVVPWGRNASEYRRMFDLTNADLAGHILGCGDGPASFNAELTREGYQVTSIDPIYAFSRAEIRDRVDATYESIIGQVKLRPERYVWREFADPDAIGAARLAVMENFLADYEAGKAAGRMNLLICHLLDTAAVAERIWDRYLAPSTKALLDELAEGM